MVRPVDLRLLHPLEAQSPNRIVVPVGACCRAAVVPGRAAGVGVGRRTVRSHVLVDDVGGRRIDVGRGVIARRDVAIDQSDGAGQRRGSGGVAGVDALDHEIEAGLVVDADVAVAAVDVNVAVLVGADDLAVDQHAAAAGRGVDVGDRDLVCDGIVRHQRLAELIILDHIIRGAGRVVRDGLLIIVLEEGKGSAGRRGRRDGMRAIVRIDHATERVVVRDRLGAGLQHQRRGQVRAQVDVVVGLAPRGDRAVDVDDASLDRDLGAENPEAVTAAAEVCLRILTGDA